MGKETSEPVDLKTFLNGAFVGGRRAPCPDPAIMLLNQRCQNLLSLQLEPLYAQLSRWTGGAMAYPSEQLDLLWQDLLKIHAQEVPFVEGESRFTSLLDAAEEMRLQALEGLVKRIDRSGMESDSYFLTVVNTLPYERAEMVEADLYPLDEDGFESFGLLDERGNPIDYDLLQPGEGEKGMGIPDTVPDAARLQQRHIRFRAVVPAGGYRTYKLFRSTVYDNLDTVMRPAPQGWMMQNEFMRVVVGADGQVDLLDSETGIESPNIFGFENAEDLNVSTNPVVSIIENKGVLLEYDFGVTLNLSLDAGSRHLSVSLGVKSPHASQRLRMLVHTDVHNDECISSQPFGCVRRSNVREQADLRKGGSETNNGLVSVKDWNKQMTIFSNGLCEYEHLRDDRGTIALSLASSSKATYRLAIRPGQAGSVVLLREMQCFLVPLLTVFDAVDRNRLAGDRSAADEYASEDLSYRLPAEEDQVLPPMESGMAVDEAMVFSALKYSQDRAGWIMRFFNPSEAPVKVMQPVLEAKVSDLNERPGDAPWMAGATVGAEKIITLRF